MPEIPERVLSDIASGIRREHCTSWSVTAYKHQWHVCDRPYYHDGQHRCLYREVDDGECRLAYWD